MQGADEQFVMLTKKGIQCYEYEYDFTTTISEFIESPGNKVAGRICKIDSEALTATIGNATAIVQVSFGQSDHNAVLLPLLKSGDIVGCEGKWRKDQRHFFAGK